MKKKLYDLISDSDTLVFDFDDTVAATEQYSWIAHNKAVEPYGIVLTKDHIKKYTGNNDKIIFSNIERDFGITINFEEHFTKRLNLYIENVLKSKLKPFPYILEVLKVFPNKKYYVLSSNSKNAIQQILEKWKIDKYFINIYSMLDLKSTKEEFIKNSINPNYFNIQSDKILLFEDSAKTINMAKQYNAKTVFIKNKLNKKHICKYDFVINT